MTAYVNNAFPVSKGNMNITEGDFEVGKIFLCVEDGELLITWMDDTTETLSAKSGEPYYFPQLTETFKKEEECKKITVVSGKFHIGT